jgi:hypothetical protein
MPIDVTCDACGARFKAPDAAAGKRGKCKKCGAVIAVPEPVPAAASDDDMYDIAEPPPLPASAVRPPSLATTIAPAPPYRPTASTASAPAAAPMLAYGVPAKNPNAGTWKNSNNPPKSFQVLKGIAGGVLLLLGLFIAGGAIYGMTRPERSLRKPFKAIFFGLFLIVTGAGLLARSMGIGGVFDED